MIATRMLQRTLCALALALLGACATAPAPAPASSASAAAGAPAGTGMAAAVDPVDPWESWNRKVFAFNEGLDAKVLKPVAETYRKVVPSIVRTGINNVLGNLYDIWSAANDLLQGKLQDGLEMGMRVIVNSTFGLAGLLDPATEMQLTRRSEDFGQTLGRWGFTSGPYVVLPLFGPSTVRDTVGLVADRAVAPSTLPPTSAGRYTVTGIELVATRTNLLATGALLDQIALDKYSFVRDAYIARRRDALYDGAPPMETFDDSGADAPPVDAGTSAPAAAAAASAAGAGMRPAAAASAASSPAK